MKQHRFEILRTPLWEEVRAILEDRATRNEALPALYRRLCQDLALAGQRGYSPQLTGYLQNLVTECHMRLYGAAVERPVTLRRWLLEEMPQRVRSEWKLLLVALLLFWGIALAVGLLVWFKPHWAYGFMPQQDLESYRQMYQPGQTRIGRKDGGDVLMFGFYIYHNVAICFRTFAGGIVGGIPALISVAFNGMSLGVVASWLSMDPATRGTFWPFVITHSSFEVTGLLLSGVAGMRMGLSLIHPGRLSRRHALLEAGRRMYPVIVGAALLTVLAAFFEGFWSAAPSIPPGVKYAVGACCWTLVIGFFTFAGRSPRAWN